MMKSGYNSTIRKEEGELKPLTNTAIPETGESLITKKRLVLVSLGLLIMGFMMGHLMNTHNSGLRMSQESMTVVDFKEEDVSTHSGQGMVVGMNLSLIGWRLSIAICLLLIY